MSLGTILLILLIFIFLGGHFGARWGNGPSGLIGLVLVVILILVLTGHL